MMFRETLDDTLTSVFIPKKKKRYPEPVPTILSNTIDTGQKLTDGYRGDQRYLDRSLIFFYETKFLTKFLRPFYLSMKTILTWFWCLILRKIEITDWNVNVHVLVRKRSSELPTPLTSLYSERKNPPPIFSLVVTFGSKIYVWCMTI